MALANRYTNTESTGSCDVTVGASGNNRIVVALLTENHWAPANHAANVEIEGINGAVITTSGGDPEGLRVRGWYWLDADLPASAGTYSVDADGNDGNGRQLSVIYYTGAKQSAPADAGNLALDYRGDITDTLTGDAGFTAVMASLWIYNSGNTVTISGDETALFNANQNNGLHVHTYNETDGGMSHDFSAFELSGMISFAIEPASGGGGGGSTIPVIQHHRMRH